MLHEGSTAGYLYGCWCFVWVKPTLATLTTNVRYYPLYPSPIPAYWLVIGVGAAVKMYAKIVKRHSRHDNLGGYRIHDEETHHHQQQQCLEFAWYQPEPPADWLVFDAAAPWVIW
jgi:hypothetical protein